MRPFCVSLTVAFVALVIPFDSFRGAASTNLQSFFCVRRVSRRRSGLVARRKSHRFPEATGQDVRHGAREARNYRVSRFVLQALTLLRFQGLFYKPLPYWSWYLQGSR